MIYIFQIFGLKIIEKEDKGLQYYIVNDLLNKIELNVEQEVNLEAHKQNLLIIILTVMYKSGGKLKKGLFPVIY